MTGASSGIGRAIAIAYGEAGASVVVNHLDDPEAAAEVVRKISAADGSAVERGADVSQENDVEALFAEAVERFGSLDILVNNAGLQRDAPVKDMALDDWKQVLDVNLTGQFLCARAAVREFLREDRGARPSRARGKIICISSVHQSIPWAGRANYAASKGGVEMLAKSLAQELAPHGIRVNTLAPGAIKTDINRDAWEDPDAEARLLELIPSGRVGEVEDVARAALWLASDASDYVQGTTLYVDGGMMLYPGFHGRG